MPDAGGITHGQAQENAPIRPQPDHLAVEARQAAAPRQGAKAAGHIGESQHLLYDPAGADMHQPAAQLSFPYCTQGGHAPGQKAYPAAHPGQSQLLQAAKLLIKEQGLPRCAPCYRQEPAAGAEAQTPGIIARRGGKMHLPGAGTQGAQAIRLR